MSIWDDKELLEELEKKRDSLRAKGKRLTFDCLNLRCRGKRAHCSKGYSLSIAKDGGLNLLIVLKGVTASICKNCRDFITE